ncbi:MAG: GNAT family N-acetyltransferase, partial [Candidatus Dormibacteria bacterium]
RFLGVDPARRRRGAARALVSACVDISRRGDRAAIVLDTLDRMTSARTLYESMGFRLVADRYADGLHLLTYELALKP